jgi:hypothetical protein
MGGEVLLGRIRRGSRARPAVQRDQLAARIALAQEPVRVDLERLDVVGIAQDRCLELWVTRVVHVRRCYPHLLRHDGEVASDF